MRNVHLCSFSGALGDMPVKRRRDPEAVLAVLREHPRFSVFEVEAKLARTLDELAQRRRLKYDASEPYPWCRVDVLPPTVACPLCGARGALATGLPGKWKHRVTAASVNAGTAAQFIEFNKRNLV